MDFRPFEIFIGLRYVRGHHSQSIAFSSLISMVGIALGIAALITVSSVLNGFDREVRARMLNAVSHVTVTPAGGRLQDWPRLAEFVGGYPHVVGYAPYIYDETVVARGKTANGVMVRGILPEAENKVSNFSSHMTAGTLEHLKPGGFGVVVGSALAESMGLQPGSPISLIVTRSQTADGISPRIRSFTVVGVFKLDMYEYDNGLILIHVDDAADVYQTQGAVTGLRLRLDDLDIAPEVGAKLSADLGSEYRVRDWTREHQTYFRLLQMQKTVIFLIVLLIVAVAMFNVVATLVVIVNEKQSDIAILRTIGVSKASLMWIFMINGALVGLAGTAFGTISGVLLALNIEGLVQALERLIDTSIISADVYLLSELPSDLRWMDVTLIAGLSMALALLSSIYPARRAAKAQPAEALRFK